MSHFEGYFVERGGGDGGMMMMGLGAEHDYHLDIKQTRLIGLL